MFFLEKSIDVALVAGNSEAFIGFGYGYCGIFYF
jgi:hypothetical protein